MKRLGYVLTACMAILGALFITEGKTIIGLFALFILAFATEITLFKREKK